MVGYDKRLKRCKGKAVYMIYRVQHESETVEEDGSVKWVSW